METNERLRDALMRAELTPQDLAEQLEVDPKTVERWITQGRAPYPKSMAKTSAILGESQTYLWPASFSEEQRIEISESEVARVYARRSQIDQGAWKRLIDESEERIHVLVMVGLFLPEQQPKLAKTLCKKAENGVDVRLLFGDPAGAEVQRRGEEEGIGDAIAAKANNVLSFFEGHVDHSCFNVRLHDTVLYNSIYRFDNEMLVNTHVWGIPAAHAPVLNLRQLPGGEMFDAYAESFEKIWDQAKPAWGGLQKAS